MNKNLNTFLHWKHLRRRSLRLHSTADSSRATGAEAIGLPVGSAKGLRVGAAIGLDVGAAIGERVGAAIGLLVGAARGVLVGAAMGLLVGDARGERVGAAMGLLVGSAIGERVGAAMGAGVGVAMHFSPAVYKFGVDPSFMTQVGVLTGQPRSLDVNSSLWLTHSTHLSPPRPAPGSLLLDRTQTFAPLFWLAGQPLSRQELSLVQYEVGAFTGANVGEATGDWVAGTGAGLGLVTTTDSSYRKYSNIALALSICPGVKRTWQELRKEKGRGRTESFTGE